MSSRPNMKEPEGGAREVSGTYPGSRGSLFPGNWDVDLFDAGPLGSVSGSIVCRATLSPEEVKMGGSGTDKVLRTAWLLFGCVTAALMLLALPSAVRAAHNAATTELVSLLPDGSHAQVGGRGWPNPVITGDGKRIFFVGGTPNGNGRQIFERSNGVTTLISTGPSPSGYSTICAPFTFGPCGFDISRDGSHVYFLTTESLVSEDQDDCSNGTFGDGGPGCTDLYERFGSATRLVSTGPTGGNGSFLVDLLGVSDDGTRAFFSTAERLVAADGDSSPDVYESVGDSLRLFPSEVAAEGDTSPIYIDRRGASPDASRVFFTTTQALVPEDTNNAADRYERTANGRVVLAPAAPTNGDATSANGKHVFFTTDKALVSSDTDSCPQYYEPPRGCFDVYERSGHTLKLISTGPFGGNGSFDADFNATSKDGKRVFFSTSEALVSSDTDACTQYFGPPGCGDIYERSGGKTTLVSTGPAGANGSYNVNFDRISDDGRRIIFDTSEPLVAADTDFCPESYEPQKGCPDIYERYKRTTILLSTGPSDPRTCHLYSDGHQSECPSFLTSSTDGRRIVFGTNEALTPADSGPYGFDIYVSSVGTP